MANITFTAAKVRPIFTDPGHCTIFDVKLTETVTPGQVLCWAAAGTMSLADGNDAALDEPQAVALQDGVANAVISVLQKGPVAGFAVSGLNVGGKVTLTDTPGVVEEAGAGENCGRIWALPGGAAVDRYIFFEFSLAMAGIG